MAENSGKNGKKTRWQKSPFTKRILHLLLDAEVSQTEIARKAGCSVQAVNDVIFGKITSARLQLAIADVVERPVEVLFPKEKAA